MAIHEQNAVLPARMAEIGRIRIGDVVKSAKGNSTRPNKLDTFRLTSSNPVLLKHAAGLWGGEPRRWENAPTEGQWELYTEVNSLPVWLPGDSAFSQFNEVWSGGGCEIRCDGQKIIAAGIGSANSTFKFSEAEASEQIGRPCLCANMDKQICKTTTRLSVILPDIPALGVWRIESHSLYGGSELQGSLAMLQGVPRLDCTLSFSERIVKRDGQTRKFPVLSLQPSDNVSLRELMATASAPQIAAPPVTYQDAMEMFGVEAAEEPPQLVEATPEPEVVEPKPKEPVPKVYVELHELMKQYGMTGTQVQDRLIAVNKEYRTVRELELTEARQMIRDITAEYEAKAAKEG